MPYQTSFTGRAQHPMMLIDECVSRSAAARRDGLRRPDDHLSSNSEKGKHNAHNNVKRC